MWGMAYYENTRTSNRCHDDRDDLHLISGLNLKKIGEDGHEIKPKVAFPVTDEKIKAGRAAMAPSSTSTPAKPPVAPPAKNEEN